MSDKDDIIAEEIRKALQSELRGTSLDVNVDVREGLVTLFGIVDTLAERNSAEKIAAKIKGISEIENNITISTDGTISDKEVEAEVINKIKEGDDEDRLIGVGAKVSKGVAILEGSVETLKDKKLAANRAEKAIGVKNVVSNIKISTAGSIDDVSISNKLTQELSTTGISLPDLEMGINRGEVHLHGHVNNINEAELAVEIAEGTEGVVRVHNTLKLRDK